VSELPVGYIDEQDGGHYRLQKQAEPAFFDYVVGPQSLKSFLFPPRETILEIGTQQRNWELTAPPPSAAQLAVIGVRSCDLHALAIQDRVFLGDEYVDTSYQARRENLLVIASIAVVLRPPVFVTR